MITYVIGFLGSNKLAAGVKLALLMSEDTPIYDLDQKIEEKDGRTIKEMVMTMGEHEYRNKEFELLKEIAERHEDEEAVVICGDGVVLDDMSMELLKQGHICYVNDPTLSMWDRAREEGNSHYAFMYEEDEDKSKESFNKLFEMRRPLYEELAQYANENNKITE